MYIYLVYYCAIMPDAGSAVMNRASLQNGMTLSEAVYIQTKCNEKPGSLLRP
jgi:hypothetical protein